jgi:hypothetical protein
MQRATREWRAQWRKTFISSGFLLQSGTSASRLRIRVRRFDSCRGHAQALIVGTEDSEPACSRPSPVRESKQAISPSRSRSGSRHGGTGNSMPAVLNGP